MKRCLFPVFLLSVVLLSAQNKLTPFVYQNDLTKDKLVFGIDPERLIYIDNLLQEYVDKGIIPQAVTFVAKNGRVIHNKAFGFQDIESKKAISMDCIFRNYSQTKAITTVALLTLFEQGKFQLDDPVSKYIPECTDQVLTELKEDGTLLTRKAKSPLTIRHLLSHTSGILANKTIGNKWKEQVLKRNKPYETLAEEVKDLLKMPLAFDPGTEWNYHPSSDVWGYLVEYFSGKSLRDYVKETILEPLGMTHTDWYFDKSVASKFVTPYQEINGKLEPRPTAWSGRNDPFGEDRRYCQAGTGLYGTIEDYARFCQMILGKGTLRYTFKSKGGSSLSKTDISKTERTEVRILSRHTVEIMMKDQLPHPNNGGDGFYFGLGFQINPGNEAGKASVSNFTPMVSAGALTWGGMYNTDYLIDNRENLIILLYTNRIPDTKVWEKFLNTVYQALD